MPIHSVSWRAMGTLEFKVLKANKNGANANEINVKKTILLTINHGWNKQPQCIVFSILLKGIYCRLHCTC